MNRGVSPSSLLPAGAIPLPLYIRVYRLGRLWAAQETRIERPDTTLARVDSHRFKDGLTRKDRASIHNVPC